MKRILLLCFCFTLVSASATSITVGPEESVKQIKKAIQLSAPGDTIFIGQGFYHEGNIIVDKRLCILGVNGPVIDGDRKFEVITVKATGTILKGLKVQHSGYATLDDPGGIKVLGCDSVVIEDNVLSENFFGVYIQYGKHCRIRNNRIISSGREEQQIGNGIHCWKSDSLVISGNLIKGHRDGIYFEFVTHSVIWRNISAGNVRYGLHFMFSNNDSYFTNIFRNNGAGVAVMFTKNVTMMNNTFEHNWGDAAYGLLLKEISDSYIAGNRFIKNTSGVFMEGTNRIVAERNCIAENGWGIKIQASCMDNVLQKNDFRDNTFDVATNGSTLLNKFNGNYWDKYEGYDLNRDSIGDVPFRPLSMYSVIAENNSSAMLLYRSFIVTLLDNSEKKFPSLTPEQFIDVQPRMKPVNL